MTLSYVVIILIALGINLAIFHSIIESATKSKRITRQNDAILYVLALMAQHQGVDTQEINDCMNNLNVK